MKIAIIAGLLLLGGCAAVPISMHDKAVLQAYEQGKASMTVQLQQCQQQAEQMYQALKAKQTPRMEKSK